MLKVFQYDDAYMYCLSNIWSSVREKVQQHWGWIGKKCCSLKKCVLLMGFSENGLHSKHCSTIFLNFAGSCFRVKLWITPEIYVHRNFVFKLKMMSPKCENTLFRTDRNTLHDSSLTPKKKLTLWIILQNPSILAKLERVHNN